MVCLRCGREDQQLDCAANICGNCANNLRQEADADASNQRLVDRLAEVHNALAIANDRSISYAKTIAEKDDWIGLLHTALLYVMRRIGVLKHDTSPNSSELLLAVETYLDSKPLGVIEKLQARIAESEIDKSTRK